MNVLAYNDTSTENQITFIKTQAIIAIVVSIIDGILILFGATLNIGVILTMMTHYHRLKTMDLFILNLCISDFTSSIFYQPLVITRLLARTKLNGIHQGFLAMASFTCLVADCASIFLVTFDKYISVKFPFRYRRYLSKNRAVVLCACAWAIAITMGLSFGIWDQPKAAGILYGILLLSMFILTATLQVASFLVAKRHARRIQETRMAFASKDKAAVACSSTIVKEETTQKNNPKQLQAFSSKAAKTITLLTMVYAMSWLPQIALNVYFIITFDANTFFKFIYLFIAFQQFHVCINPFIYVFRTRYIREKFFKGRTEIGVSLDTRGVTNE